MLRFRQDKLAIQVMAGIAFSNNFKILDVHALYAEHLDLCANTIRR